MVELAQEPLTPELAAEVYPLARVWWEARSKLPLDPNLEVFFLAHYAGDLRVYTARDEGKLVGYAVFVLSKSIFTGVLRAQAVSISANSIGWAGYKLINFCVDTLLADGVIEVTMDSTETKDISSLYERAGFKKNSTEYIRRA